MNHAWVVAMIGSLSGFLFGYDEGVIAGSLELVTRHFHLNPMDVGVMASALPLGALFGSLAIGAFLGSRAMKTCGRRVLLFFAAVLFLVGALGAAMAWSVVILIASRLILGLAIGFASVVTPLYLAECAPLQSRGAMVSMYQLAITLGIFASYGVNYALLSSNGWSLMFASSALPALLLALTVMWLPESPRWLISRHRVADATRMLKRLRGQSYQQEEINHIVSTLANEPQQAKWQHLFSKHLFPIVSLGMLLFCFQQMCGINVIIYFAPEIFKQLGFSNTTGQLLATMGIGVLNVGVTVLAMYTVDTVGRRPLLLFGFAGAGLSLLLISFFASLQMPSLAGLSLLALCVYIFSFAISIGPVPHIAMAEIFPLHLRGAGMGFSSMSNWFFNTLMIFSFPLLQHHVGLQKTFMLYAMMCGIAYIYTWYFMPETRQLSLESIEDHLMQGLPLSALGKEEDEDECNPTLAF